MECLKCASKFSKVFRSNQEDQEKVAMNFFSLSMNTYREMEDMSWGSNGHPRFPHSHPNLLNNLDMFSPFLSPSPDPILCFQQQRLDSGVIHLLKSFKALYISLLSQRLGEKHFFFWQIGKNDFGFEGINDYIPKDK